MPVITRNIHIKTSRENDIVDITEQTSTAVKESKIKNGIVTVFVAGSTAAITTIEYEPGLKEDFPKMLSRIAPKGIEYEHDNT
ncbi:MAG: YjbQ family protein, partial [Thermoproteota archaeon]|nr:YjbQ family protein [Thermoproteota archaeon]